MCTEICVVIQMLLATGYDPVPRKENKGNDATIWYCGPYCFGVELPSKRGPHRRYAHRDALLHPNPHADSRNHLNPHADA
jgi:hypothetical protein